MTWWKRVKRRIGAARRDVLWRAVHWGWREFQRAGLVTADTPAGRAFRRFGRGSIMAFPPGSVFGENGIKATWVVYTFGGYWAADSRPAGGPRLFN